MTHKDPEALKAYRRAYRLIVQGRPLPLFSSKPAAERLFWLRRETRLKRR